MGKTTNKRRVATCMRFIQAPPKYMSKMLFIH